MSFWHNWPTFLPLRPFKANGRLLAASWKVLQTNLNMPKKKSEEQIDETLNQEVEAGAEEVTSEKGTEEQTVSPEEKLKGELSELNDKYLRLYSEFDNFRKRTNRERAELFKSAGKDILSDLLGVIDDLERALNAEDKDVESMKNGMDLIYNKLKGTLKSHGLKPFESKNEKFDPELHDAITKIPAPSKKLKGKVVDEIEKGYMLHDKVLRYSKVVVGE